MHFISHISQNVDEKKPDILWHKIGIKLALFLFLALKVSQKDEKYLIIKHTLLHILKVNYINIQDFQAKPWLLRGSCGFDSRREYQISLFEAFLFFVRESNLKVHGFAPPGRKSIAPRFG